MRIVVTPIPNKSYGVRVWPNLEDSKELPEDKRSYTFACNLIHVDDDTCEVTQAMGEFSNEIAIQLGLKAIELGYKILTFSRSTGGPVTRWATYIKTENGLDYYQVDLIGKANDI